MFVLLQMTPLRAGQAQRRGCDALSAFAQGFDCVQCSKDHLAELRWRTYQAKAEANFNAAF
jgi:hypothetical protein